MWPLQPSNSFHSGLVKSRSVQNWKREGDIVPRGRDGREKRKFTAIIKYSLHISSLGNIGACHVLFINMALGSLSRYSTMGRACIE